MKNNIFNAQNEQFYIDCEVIETKYEYPQYTGVEKWIIITDLTEEELNGKYAEQIAPLKPYIILSRSFGEVRKDFRRNEKKHHMRAVRSGHAFDFSEETEEHHTEIATNDLEEDFLLREEIEELRNAIQLLTQTQRERLIKFFFEGKSSRVIAKEEGVAYSAVDKSIAAAIKNLKNILD